MDKLIKVKTFQVKLDNEFHREIKLAAYMKDITLHEYIVQAIREKLEKDKKKDKKEGEKDGL